MCTEKFVRRDLVGEFHRRRATLQSDLGVTGALEHISVVVEWYASRHPANIFSGAVVGSFLISSTRGGHIHEEDLYTDLK